MKCPKCGFTSFDYLNECKKCGVDISDVRSTLGVIAISPDERAASRPSGPEPEMIDDSFDDTGEIMGEDQLGGGGGDDFLGAADDETFEETFEGMVEHTSYDDQLGGEETQEDELAVDLGEEPAEIGDIGDIADDAGAGSPEFDKSEVEPEEEFLDLDFGGIFEDEE